MTARAIKTKFLTNAVGVNGSRESDWQVVVKRIFLRPPKRRDGQLEVCQSPRRVRNGTTTIVWSIVRTDETAAVAAAAGNVIVIGVPTLSAYGPATTSTTWLSVVTVVTSARWWWRKGGTYAGHVDDKILIK